MQHLLILHRKLTPKNWVFSTYKNYYFFVISIFRTRKLLSMKTILSLFFCFILLSPASAQSKKRDIVKRKYRTAKAASTASQPVFIRGAVYDEAFRPLAGATVTIDGSNRGVNTNEDGQYLIEGLVSGRARVRVSFIGYKTRTADIILRAGKNEKSLMLLTDERHLEPLAVNALKREQQILDIPTAVTAISENTLQQSTITNLSLMSEFVPGLSIIEQGANQTDFVVRGISNLPSTPGSQARVSVYFNNVPLGQNDGSALELYDMHVEAVRGPQNVLFGKNAMAGAIHYVSNMPTSDFYGSLSSGMGNFNQTEVRGFVNIPVFKDRLMLRAAGIYSTYDGSIRNTFGGRLMGKETVGGRFSTRFRPAWNHRIDLVLNYQKDDTPGLAFLTDSLANTEGETGIFSGLASLEQGENLGTGKELASATLNYRFYLNENNYWTSITSYRKNDANARWDGDGTAAQAIDMATTSSSSKFFQEIRGNFSNSRSTGVLGISYWRETRKQTDWFSTNEQHLANVFAGDSLLPLVNGSGQPISIPSLAIYNATLDSTITTALSTEHQEESYSKTTNSSIEGFLDVSHQLSRKFFVSGGIRVVYERLKLGNEAGTTAGDSSALGEITGNAPNVLFYPSDWREFSKSSLSFTYHGGLKYRFNEYGSIYANYAHGRRPQVLQFSSDGEKEVLDPEILDHYELGIKGTYSDRVFIDINGFYQNYKNFQTQMWQANADSSEYTLALDDAGKATLYGAEAHIRVAILKQLDAFANYAWLHTKFDSTNVDGTTQAYAGNSFRVSPEHSFTIGASARINLIPTLVFFATPTYAYKTHFFFDDANTPGMQQKAYGVLNITGGLELSKPNIILSFWAHNVLDEEYISSAGNSSALFGFPTFIPGSSRMIGTKLTWNFSKKEKRRGRIFL